MNEPAKPHPPNVHLVAHPVGADGFLVEDILDLYHGRGAFEAVLADEDIEEDPDRWCSYTECGQELWQIASQW